MSAFTGKWKKVSATNVDGLVAATGLAGEKASTLKTFLSDSDVMEEINVTDAGMTRNLYVNGALKREVTSSFGSPQERETMLGKSTLLGKKVSDTRIEVNETAAGRPDATMVLIAEGSTMFLDYTVGGVTCRRTFNKL